MKPTLMQNIAEGV